MKWSIDTIPDLSDKISVITGANSGLGYETAKIMASKGATVVMACRNMQKAQDAKQLILQDIPEANLVLSQLDLADLSSIKTFADNLKVDRIDLMFNNAGLMAIPQSKTVDGFETQFGVNHLGHFALTGILLDKILNAENSRIITLASLFHMLGRINFDDLMFERRKYRKFSAYAQSKLSNLIFTNELQRKLSANNKSTIAVAAHPGYATTHLQTKGTIMSGRSFNRKMVSFANFIMGYSAYKGAMPQIRAATDTEAMGGDYYGPLILNYLWPHKPRKVWSKRVARNKSVGERLWKVSEELTGVEYSF